jgi:hypothetical protein
MPVRSGALVPAGGRMLPALCLKNCFIGQDLQQLSGQAGAVGRHATCPKKTFAYGNISIRKSIYSRSAIVFV